MEGTGEFTQIDGDRKPWMKLAQLQRPVVALALWVDGRYVYCPHGHTSKFDLVGVQPSWFALYYHLEVDDVFGEAKQTHYVDVAAGYPRYVVHTVVEAQSGQTWVMVTVGDEEIPAEALVKAH